MAWLVLITHQTRLDKKMLKYAPSLPILAGKGFVPGKGSGALEGL
jgi:hypothetical protein